MACVTTLKLFKGEFEKSNWSKGRYAKKQKMGESEGQLNSREIRREVKKHWMQGERIVYSKCKNKIKRNNKIPPNAKAHNKIMQLQEDSKMRIKTSKN